MVQKTPEDEKKKLTRAVKNFKQKVGDPVKISGPGQLISEYINENLKDLFATFTAEVNEKLSIYDESINFIKHQQQSQESTMKEWIGKIDGAVGVVKFLFGAGCLLTLVNIIIFIISLILTR